MVEKENKRRRRGLGGIVLSFVLKSRRRGGTVSCFQSGRRVKHFVLISSDRCLPVGNYTVPKAHPVRREQERNGGLDQLAKIGSVQRALRGKSTVFVFIH